MPTREDRDEDHQPVGLEGERQRDRQRVEARRDEHDRRREQEQQRRPGEQDLAQQHDQRDAEQCGAGDDRRQEDHRRQHDRREQHGESDDRGRSWRGVSRRSGSVARPGMGATEPGESDRSGAIVCEVELCDVVTSGSLRVGGGRLESVVLDDRRRLLRVGIVPVVTSSPARSSSSTQEVVVRRLAQLLRPRRRLGDGIPRLGSICLRRPCASRSASGCRR